MRCSRPRVAPPGCRSSRRPDLRRSGAQQRRKRYSGNQRSALHRPSSLSPTRLHPSDNLPELFGFSSSNIRSIPMLLRRIRNCTGSRCSSGQNHRYAPGCELRHDAPPRSDRNSHEIPPFGRQGPRPRPHEGHLGGGPDALRRGPFDRREGLPQEPAALGRRSRHRRRVHRRQAERVLLDVGRRAQALDGDRGRRDRQARPASSPRAPTRTWTR